MRLTRIIIVEVNDSVRQALESILGSHDSISIVASLKTAGHAVAATERERPDVVLADADLFGADVVSGIRAIKSASPRTRVLTLCVHPYQLETCKFAGADAALLKDAGREELVRAVLDL